MASSSASRLDRLVILLETGSTHLIRNTAADQLADVQKQHPDELFNLLNRVIPFLRSKAWDTRVAAARAVGGIVDNADKFDPNADAAAASEPGGSAHPVGGSSVKPEDGDIAVKQENDQDGAVKKQEDSTDGRQSHMCQLRSLDPAAVLNFGKVLLASPHRDFDLKMASMDDLQRLDHQKKTLNLRLGLGGPWTDPEIPTDQDTATQSKSIPIPALSKIDTSVSCNAIASASHSPRDELVATPCAEAGNQPSLSKRQLNAAKRKAKKEAQNRANKVHIRDVHPSTRRSSTQIDHMSTPATAQPLAVKLEPSQENGDAATCDYFSLDRQGGDDASKVVNEFKGLPVAEKSAFEVETEDVGVEWPFEPLCEYLVVDLFDPHWEIRHGAAMALRDVLRMHGAGAGRRKGLSRASNDAANQRWLDDLACRICIVFMLDRFGDYVSDNVVAPIRETAGQAFGAVLQHLSLGRVLDAFRVLHELVAQKFPASSSRVWQAAHGGMIGMRYLVAVRKDVLLQDRSLLEGVVSVVMEGLSDFDDDVRAVSAATLVPVAKEVVEQRPHDLEGLILKVWECLSNLQDDLSASTGSIMDLLAKLCSFSQVLSAMKENAKQDSRQSFQQLVPRLFPFLRHTITSVRSAVLRALITFLDIEGDGTDGWIDTKALRLLFQNVLLERNEGVLQLSQQVWNSVVDRLAHDADGQGQRDVLVAQFEPMLDAVIPLTLTPIGVALSHYPMDLSLLIRPSGQTFGPPPQSLAQGTPGLPETGQKHRRKSQHKKDDSPLVSSTHNVDGPMTSGDAELIGMNTLIKSRTCAAKAIGRAMALWPAAARQRAFERRLVPHLTSTRSTTQLTAVLIVEEFAQRLEAEDELGRCLARAVLPMVEEVRPAYEDIVPLLRAVRGGCAELAEILVQGRCPNITKPPPVCQGDPIAGQYAFSAADAEHLLNVQYEKHKKAMPPTQRVLLLQSMEAARLEALSRLQKYKDVKELRDIRIKSAAAAALVALHGSPQKSGLVIKAMMDSVKKEDNAELQKRSSVAVASLIGHLVRLKRSNMVNKIIGNLVKFYCMETAETPEFHINASIETGILSLKKEEDVRDHKDAETFEAEARAARITKRGARSALEQMVETYGCDVFEELPVLKQLIEAPIREAFTPDESDADMTQPDNTLGQQVVDGISLLRALVEKLHPDARGLVKDLLPLVAKALRCRLGVLRYAAAKCFATICSAMTVEGITMLVETVLPAVNNAGDVRCRQGAIETVYHLIHVMNDRILPYVIFLITPVLGRMSDSDNSTRLLATTSFATLVKLVPLEAGIPDPPGLSEELLKGRDRERKFVAQMLDAKKVEPFEIPVAISATLRSYQQDGVNWLAFLNRYHLHGILCDDMGLGKTLQTLCMVASDHHLRAEEFAKTQDAGARRLPSLIVCPPTLSGHWQQEIRQYAPFLTCVPYVGPPAQRARHRSQLDVADVVITSYEACRKDIDVLAPLSWNYCVLDEGHLIKNSKSKISQAVKKLTSNHRLILSGTPIQNNVLELWSLFDFLMPGFLGTEKVFQERFAKPIAASRFSKSSSKEQEAGALAIEALHKQVLPFLLRRLKEEVLDDLPPKILQNYYCDLSDLQRKLFEDFHKKEATQLSALASDESRESKQHIFQALQYMRKLCNSPALVMTPSHKQYAVTQDYLRKRGSSLSDMAHAPKLTALKDLLVDCGIGADAATESSSTVAGAADLAGAAAGAVSQHRALIFCQMKEMLDMVEREVLGKMLPSVQALRLDGSVEASRRQDIVNRFNRDPSYDVLLLTTSVGGLGLNLTGADTVIFVEHDWNPQKDIQAMDRAHRIGQKKVVNVYRIVTRGTLEEKILNLQRFKIDVASTVVNQQNSGLGTMQTDQLLDLFNVSADGAGAAVPPPDAAAAADDDDAARLGADNAVDATGELRQRGQKGVLDDLGELWDERQYDEEFDLGGFLERMKA